MDDGRVERLAREIFALLSREPRHFIEVLQRFREHDYRLFLLAWSRVREQHRLERDRAGRYVVPRREP